MWSIAVVDRFGAVSRVLTGGEPVESSDFTQATELNCKYLAEIERVWPSLRRVDQRHLTKDVDLCRYELRDDSDIYNLTSKTRLNADGELQRIRERWSQVREVYREQLYKQASEAFLFRRRNEVQQ